MTKSVFTFIKQCAPSHVIIAPVNEIGFLLVGFVPLSTVMFLEIQIFMSNINTHILYFNQLPFIP